MLRNLPGEQAHYECDELISLGCVFIAAAVCAARAAGIASARSFAALVAGFAAVRFVATAFLGVAAISFDRAAFCCAGFAAVVTRTYAEGGESDSKGDGENGENFRGVCHNIVIGLMVLVCRADAPLTI